MLNTKMNTHIMTDINLAQDGLWKTGGDRRGDVISCVDGRLWVTQEGDMHDYVIGRGERFWVTRPGMIVVQAMEDSQFKYSLNELDSHVESNVQPTHDLPRHRVNRPSR